eukprot:1629879-Rhodomonas_salina.2
MPLETPPSPALWVYCTCATIDSKDALNTMTRSNWQGLRNIQAGIAKRNAKQARKRMLHSELFPHLCKTSMFGCRRLPLLGLRKKIERYEHSSDSGCAQGAEYNPLHMQYQSARSM